MKRELCHSEMALAKAQRDKILKHHSLIVKNKSVAQAISRNGRNLARMLDAFARYIL